MRLKRGTIPISPVIFLHFTALKFHIENCWAEEARKGAAHFTNNRHQMDYADYRAKGYQIGSGTVESACKQLGIQRMKVAGAIWSLEGACRTAKARAALLSGQWDALTARREHLRRAA